MRERDIEQYLVKRVKQAGGEAYKWVSPGNSGVPDRIVVLPGGLVIFVECKAPGKRPTALQHAQLHRLLDLSVPVYIIDSTSQVDMLLEDYQDYLSTWHEMCRKAEVMPNEVHST